VYDGKIRTKIAVKELLDILKTNLEKHQGEFHEAFKEYQKVAAKRLRMRADSLEKGSAKNHMISLKVPVDYSDSYRQVIEMLEMSESEHIELDWQQFRQYIKDEWHWKKDFTTLNTMYLEGSI
jgi:hypothetical protein